ncbi:MAG TPA: OsmC family protein [Candidatus Binatia bacterium]|nr:OsmC family protein [Candidatus Binatia bacterium]
METGEFSLTLELAQGYEFVADFHQAGVAPLVMDEPPPLGDGRGPSAARVLAAAVGNCLAASALHCLRKARVEVRGLRADVHGRLVRNEQGRLRVGRIAVTIRPEVAPADHDRMARCLELFEDFCVVTQSVRSGIDVKVDVKPRPAGG